MEIRGPKRKKLDVSANPNAHDVLNNLRGIATLPEVLLNNIMSYLEFKDVVAFLLVSARLRSAFCYRLSVTEDLDLTLFRHVTSRDLVSILGNCTSLQNLTLSHEYIDVNKALKKAVPTSLRSLSLYHVDLSWSYHRFLETMRYFSNGLTALSLCIVPAGKPKVRLEDVLNQFPLLESFKYFFETQGAEEEFGDWYRGVKLNFRKIKCPRLTSLELTNLQKEYIETIPATLRSVYLYYTEFASPRAVPSRIQILTLIGRSGGVLKGFGFYTKHPSSACHHPEFPLDCDSLVPLSICKEMEFLALSIYCKCKCAQKRSINDMNMMNFASGQSQLRQLRLDGLKNVTEAAIISLVSCNNRLQEISLDFSSASDETVECIATSANLQLRVLSLKGCHLDDEVCLKTLFKNCPVLEKIDLTCVRRVTNFTLLNVYLHCSHLKSIVLVRNDVDNIGVRCLLQTVSLREIKISETPDVNDELMIFVLLGLPKETESTTVFGQLPVEHELVRQYIPRLPAVYDPQRHAKMLRSIREEVPSLIGLDVSATCLPYLDTLYLNESGITNYGLRFILDSCKRLFKLSMNGCQVTAEPVTEFLRAGRCPSLGCCSLVGTDRISSRAGEELAELCREEHVKLSV